MDAAPSAEPASAPIAPTADPALGNTSVERLQFLAEMGDLPSEWLPDSPVGADPQQDAAFAERWAKLRSELSPSLTNERIVELSRWARDEMQGYRLPEEWLASLELSPRFATKGGVNVVFGTHPRAALKLPTHAAAVDRRLHVYAEYSPRDGQILRVVVTIRGDLNE